MLSIRYRTAFLALVLCSNGAVAQASAPIDWPMLPDPDAQEFEDPYRDLSKPQFASLMDLARTQIALDSGELGKDERNEKSEQAASLIKKLQAQGLDPEWILAQREAVAERRERAAVSTNPALDGEDIELTGFMIVAPDMEDGEMVAYLLPDRGICMHLPAPVPNQLIRLDIEQLPEPLGACIATAVRGQLSSNESTATIPVLDHTVTMWSSWRLDVSEATTGGGELEQVEDHQHHHQHQH